MGWSYSMHGKYVQSFGLGNTKENRPLRRLRWQNYNEMCLVAIEWWTKYLALCKH